MLAWDFTSVRNRLITSLQSKSSWAGILPWATNLRIIDAVAEEISDLAQYDEYLTVENKWSLAKNTSSLMALEDIHHYQAYRKIGAFGTLRMGVSALISSSNWLYTTTYTIGQTIYYDDILYTALGTSLNKQPDLFPADWDPTDISPTYNVGIPKWTIFQNQSGTVKFCTYEANTLLTTENFVDLNVVQGTPKTSTNTAQGLSNESILINDATVENSHYELYVNSVLWTKVTSLLDYASTDQVYEIENLPDFSGIYLNFGNDIYGKKLSAGDEVKLYYISTDGGSGNVLSTNIINKVTSTLYDSNGDTPACYCTNQSTLMGGKEYEDIESIRNNAPQLFQSGERASNSADYEIIINSISFILKSMVWGSYEVNTDAGNNPWTYILAEENMVHIAAISQSEENLTQAQQIYVSEFINSYKAPTDIVTYETVKFINLAFTVSAYVTSSSYTLNSVSNAIRTLLATNYSVSALDFYQNIYFSDLNSSLDAIAGIDHHDTSVEIFYDYALQSQYTVSFNIPTYPIEAGSMRVYLQDLTNPTVFTLIANDNYLGAFTQVSPAVLTGTIDYNNGYGYLNITSATGLTPPYTNYSVRIFYSQTTNNLILNSRQSIFKFDSTNTTITCAYV